MKNLIVQSVLGLAFLILVLAAILFFSAGSLNFWQGWTFLGVFAVCCILITTYLIKYDQNLLAGRVDAVPMAETRKLQQVVATLANIFFMGVFLVPGLDYRFHWSNVPASLSIISDIFVVLGFVIIFLTFRENSFTSGVIEVTEKQKVISTGPYSMVRHPMYAGAFLMLIFAPLAMGSWVALPFPLPLIATIIVRLLDEEKFLMANLSGYEEYRQKVRYRLIPFVW
jgi:protein-S-isoprenylcysteine O-methyltransferase Ste14